jgi:hypothetical protein
MYEHSSSIELKVGNINRVLNYTNISNTQKSRCRICEQRGHYGAQKKAAQGSFFLWGYGWIRI